MSVPSQPVTLSMFWPLLLFAAGNDTTTSERAADRIAARDGASGEIGADAVAEELAREHFPSGTTDRAVGFYATKDGWADDRDLYDTFEEMLDGLEGAGPLSPADPSHVAMVARVIAISAGLAVYVEAPVMRIGLDAEWSEEPSKPAQQGYVVRLERSRPGGAGPVSTGHFFPYADGQTAETVNYGEALFAAFLVRHAEVVAYFEAQSPDPSGAVPNPGPTAT